MYNSVLIIATLFLQRKELSHNIAKYSNHVQTSVSSEGNIARSRMFYTTARRTYALNFIQ